MCGVRLCLESYHNAVGLSCSAAPLSHRDDALAQQLLQDLTGLWTHVWQTEGIYYISFEGSARSWLWPNQLTFSDTR